MNSSTSQTGPSGRAGEEEGLARGMLRIRVNGEERAVPEGTTAAGLLELLELHAGMVVVERNREIVERSRLDQEELAQGDQVELVHFVGGG